MPTKPARLTTPSPGRSVDPQTRRTAQEPGVIRMLVDTGAKGPARFAVDLTPDAAVELAEELLGASRIARRLAQEQKP